jgi:hypothetical protein
MANWTESQPSYSSCPPAGMDNSERLRDRVKRHVDEIKAGKIDPQAIVRGGTQILDKLTLVREDDAKISSSTKTPDYLGLSGLDFNAYALTVPVGPTHLPTSLELTTFRSINVRILDLPVDSNLVVFVTHQGQKPVHTNAFLNRVNGAIASITGPTFSHGDDLPNNGFYFQPTSDFRPFMETNPPGERRGAFGLTLDGQLQLLTDQDKWQIVNQDFDGYCAVVGTSHYILGSDNDQDYGSLAQVHKNCLSYLMAAEEADGRTRFSFIRNERMLSRDRLRKLMQYHSIQANRRMLMAVELEFGNASCVVKSADGKKSEFGTGFNERRDHYLFVRN